MIVLVPYKNNKTYLVCNKTKHVLELLVPSNTSRQPAITGTIARLPLESPTVPAGKR